MITKEIAKSDLSLARCWEGHANSLSLLDGIATPDQKARWFAGVIERGDKWVAWSGEPQAREPAARQQCGTTITRVADGYIVEGTKVFATSATAAQWAILLVSLDGPGGIRHAGGDVDSQLLLCCDLSDPSVTMDSSWWDPIGMRGTVSYLVRFNRTFISETNSIGYPGQYVKEAWQTYFIPHYAATFLGAAEAAYDFALDYVTNQKKRAIPTSSITSRRCRSTSRPPTYGCGTSHASGRPDGVRRPGWPVAAHAMSSSIWRKTPSNTVSGPAARDR